MKVVLVKDVDKVGKEGQLLDVKDGFARNFLIAKGLALVATKDSLKKIDAMKKQQVKVLEAEKKRFSEVAKKLSEISITISTQVKEDEEIYGSITEAQILKELTDEGIELKKGVIILSEPIKKIGAYNLKVDLHPEIQANLRVWVVKK